MNQITIGYYCNGPKQFRLDMEISSTFSYVVNEFYENGLVKEITIDLNNQVEEMGIHSMPLSGINFPFPPQPGIGNPKPSCIPTAPIQKNLEINIIPQGSTSINRLPPKPYDQAQHKG